MNHKKNIPLVVLYMNNKQIGAYYEKISNVLTNLNFRFTGVIEEGKWWRIPVAFILLQLPNFQSFINSLKTQVKHFLIDSKLVIGVEKFGC